MKNNLLITLSALLILWGCDETSTSVFSLTKEEFTKEMKDSMELNIESYGSQIELKGDLSLIEGECFVSLMAPSGDTIFSVDTTYVPDTIFSIERINLTDTIFSIDSIFIADTIFTPDTILKYKTMYKNSFKATNTFAIDEKFDRILGKWTFNYEIKMVEKVTPQGSFDFVIKYID